MKQTTTAAKKSTAAAKKVTAKKASPKRQSASSSGGDEAADLRELFIDGLKDIYWAEKALTKALPKMAKKATAEELMTAINDHLEVTQQQVTRLEEVFSAIGERAVAKKCEAMDGLLKEAEEIMGSTKQGPVRDAGIIMAGQKVEHYEIASYGTLYAFANILGEEDAASLLQQTLDEEKEADEKLTEVAESSINISANEEEDDDESDDEEDTEEEE